MREKDFTENHGDEKVNHREIKNTLTITVWLYRLVVSLVHFILGMIGCWAVFRINFSTVPWSVVLLSPKGVLICEL